MPEKNVWQIPPPAGTETGKNTWLAEKSNAVIVGIGAESHQCAKHTGYFRCTKRTKIKLSGLRKISKEEFEQFIFSAMQEKFKRLSDTHGREEKVNPKPDRPNQVRLAQVEAEIENAADTLTGANWIALPTLTKKLKNGHPDADHFKGNRANEALKHIPQQIKKLFLLSRQLGEHRF